MSLVKVQIPNNVHPRQIEFDKDTERSKPGALYFVPGTVKYLTSDEYRWIEKHDKKFFRLLRLLPNETESSSQSKNVSVNIGLKKRKTKESKRKFDDEISKLDNTSNTESK